MDSAVLRAPELLRQPLEESTRLARILVCGPDKRPLAFDDDRHVASHGYRIPDLFIRGLINGIAGIRPAPRCKDLLQRVKARALKRFSPDTRESLPAVIGVERVDHAPEDVRAESLHQQADIDAHDGSIWEAPDALGLERG